MRLLKFEAPWCTKCKTVTQILDQMDLPFIVEKVNIDECESKTLLEYGIRGIPHMILLDENNNIVTRVGGVLTKEQLTEAFQLQP